MLIRVHTSPTSGNYTLYMKIGQHFNQTNQLTKNHSIIGPPHIKSDIILSNEKREVREGVADVSTLQTFLH